MYRSYGWRPDLPDKRDKLHVPRDMGASLPRIADLSGAMPPCWDQLSLGSCTAFAIGGAFAYERAQQEQEFVPSFLQAYYAARELEGTTPIDAGAYIRDICKVAAQQGLAPAEAWPYWIARYTEKPGKGVRKAALDNRISSYARIARPYGGDGGALRATLASGDTIVCGVSVYESFEDVGDAGIVPLPAARENLLGGHAILLVGYSDDDQLFKFRNSWGTAWGDNGYGYLPYEYVLDPDLADDFWVIKCVTEAA